MMAWCDLAGQIPLADMLTSHLDVIACGLAEPAGGLA